MDSEQEKRMAQYLLGQLSEQDQLELENQYLADDSCFEELLAVEDELRDAYVRDELSKPDREAFEQRLLSDPQQLQKQEFARTLRHRLMQLETRSYARSHTRSAWKSLLGVLKTRQRMVLIPVASVALAILIVGGWWLRSRATKPLESHNAPTVVPSATGPSNEMPPVQAQEPPTSQQPEAGIITAILTPGLVRGGGQSKSISIPADVSRVRLEARFTANFSTYRAVLQTPEGRTVLTENNLKAQPFAGRMRVFFDLSSAALPPGDYILSLRGFPASGKAETVAEYAFRISRR